MKIFGDGDIKIFDATRGIELISFTLSLKIVPAGCQQ